MLCGSGRVLKSSFDVIHYSLNSLTGGEWRFLPRIMGNVVCLFFLYTRNSAIEHYLKTSWNKASTNNQVAHSSYDSKSIPLENSRENERDFSGTYLLHFIALLYYPISTICSLDNCIHIGQWKPTVVTNKWLQFKVPQHLFYTIISFILLHLSV